MRARAMAPRNRRRVFIAPPSPDQNETRPPLARAMPPRKRRRAFIAPPSPDQDETTPPRARAMPPRKRPRAFIAPPSPDQDETTPPRARAMPPRKRPRAFIAPPSPDHDETTPPQTQPPLPEKEEGEPPAPTLPDDLLLEIAARSDFTTLVRFAACCRALRRDILMPAFIRRVSREPAGPGAAVATVPPRVLGFLHAYDRARMAEEYQDRPPAPCFSAAHPATRGVASFFEKHLAPFAARTAGASLLGDYEPLTSRNGLVVLRRRYLGGDRSSDMCVYDPMSGDRTFLPSQPGFRIWDREASDYGVSYTYVLLTAADGIGSSSFLVLAADFTGLDAYSANLKVQTVSSDDEDDGKYAWAPVTMAAHPRSRRSSLQPHSSAVVLHGLIHWLMYDGEAQFHILTYDVRTATAGSIELPKEKDALPSIAKESSCDRPPDGSLSLHVPNKQQKISVWLLRPAGGGWSRHAVIDIARAVWSLTPTSMPYYWWLKEVMHFASSGERSGAVVVRPFNCYFPDNSMEKESDSKEEEGEEVLGVLDMETEELRRVNKRKHITVFPYEIDLEARLSAMKTF